MPKVEVKRIKKQITITLPPELNDRWNAVAKKHHLIKSHMIEELLEMILPTLEESDPKAMIKSAIKLHSDSMGKLSDSL